MRPIRFITPAVSAAFLIIGGFAFVARSAAPTPIGDGVIGKDAGPPLPQAEGPPKESVRLSFAAEDAGRLVSPKRTLPGVTKRGASAKAQSATSSRRSSATLKKDGAGVAARGIPNDICLNAQPVLVGSEVNGTTLGATADVAELCGGPLTAPGVWYVVIGTGATITAELCSGGTSWDSRISVYCGSCLDQICTASDDDGCGITAGPSKVSWC